MFKATLVTLVQEQIRLAGQKLHTSKSTKLDDMAYGKLGFYLALRRVLQGTSTPEDLGLMDAVNDVLQALELLDSDETFLASIKQDETGK